MRQARATSDKQPVTLATSDKQPVTLATSNRGARRAISVHASLRLLPSERTCAMGAVHCASLHTNRAQNNTLPKQ